MLEGAGEFFRRINLLHREGELRFAEVNCHPLINSATTRVATGDLIRFIEACGHTPHLLVLT